MNRLPILGLTMGDPAGIGPEICVRALNEPAVLEHCIPVLFGDTSVLKLLEARGLFELKTPVRPLAEWDQMDSVGGALIIDCGAMDVSSLERGRISPLAGKAAFKYIEHSIRGAVSGKLAGVVTAPIHKESLRLAGVPFPGHTEIFTTLTNAPRSCMMLLSQELTVSMVTTHIGYADVPQKLSVDRIHDVITLTHQAMRRMLQREPRLAICGLNPHAGEHGLFGQKEEENHIEPAVMRAREAGIRVEGPLPPDTAFTSSVRSRTDAIVTMYHDQGHIPFKMLAFDTGVNITLGLPIIRTSVDHGTAFDIAWHGKASPTSLYSAVKVAADLAAGASATISTP